jgi:hypothetical protein
MGSRIDAFRALLTRLRASGYRFETITEFLLAAERGEQKDQPVCLLRVDVDTDPQGAAAMFAAMHELGIRATYYFRLSTIDGPLARRISQSGDEVGYHFEEIASFAKRKGLLNRERANAHFDAMHEDFHRNVECFARQTGIRPRSAAAHGDFANRRLRMSNSELITPRLLRDTEIVVHTSYARLDGHHVARYSDAPAPVWWRPSDPGLAPASGPIAVLFIPGSGAAIARKISESASTVFGTKPCGQYGESLKARRRAFQYVGPHCRLRRGRQWRATVPYTIHEIGTKVAVAARFSARG